MPLDQDPKLLRRLLRAKDRIDAASHEAWPVERLARVSGVSEAHFARSFKEAFGIPPHRYLLTRRVERAGRAWARSGARFAILPGTARAASESALVPRRVNSAGYRPVF